MFTSIFLYIFFQFLYKRPSIMPLPVVASKAEGRIQNAVTQRVCRLRVFISTMCCLSSLAVLKKSQVEDGRMKASSF